MCFQYLHSEEWSDVTLCKLLHATQKQNIFRVTCKHKHVQRFLNLLQGECKQQQEDGDNNTVGILSEQ